MSDDEWMVEQQRLHNMRSFQQPQPVVRRTPMEIAMDVLEAKPQLVSVWLHRKRESA